MSPPLMNLLVRIGELSMDSGSKGYNNLIPIDKSLRLEKGGRKQFTLYFKGNAKPKFIFMAEECF